jgi:FG-GAP-like repeat
MRRFCTSILIALVSTSLLVCGAGQAEAQAIGTVNIWQAQGGGRFAVGNFLPWNGYRIPNGVWLTGDFNRDSLTDLVHLVQNSNYVHVWLARGNGTFDVRPPFSPSPSYVIPNGDWLVGDFNGDFRSDLVHLVPNTNYVNVWLSRGDGTFDVQQFSPGSGYVIPNGVWLAGDVNGDRRTDLIHVVQNTNYVNVWLSRGNGTFDVRPFSPWSSYRMVNGEWHVGDFNGDGAADLVHLVQNSSYAHVWLSRRDGTFDVRSPFTPWPGYVMSNGQWMVGDFDHDGRADLAHLVPNGPAASVNVWRSNADGTFQVTSFRPWPDYVIPNGEWLTGDFDGDGRSDLLHLVNNADYANVWLSLGNGRFNVVQYRPWAGYVMTGNGPWRAGAFTRDDRTDVVHLLRSDDVDIASVSISRYATIALSPAHVDSILTDATTVLLARDTPTDVTCKLGFVRNGNVGAFSTLTVPSLGLPPSTVTVPFDGTIDNMPELMAVWGGAPGDVRVVNGIFWCPPGPGIYSGCAAPTRGAVVVDSGLPINVLGVVWAHEWGHTRGLWHHTEPNVLMNPGPGAGNREINAFECFTLDPRHAIASGLGGGAAVATVPKDVREFVHRTFIESVPYELASRYDATAVPALQQMLSDPREEPYWSNIALTLGFIGDQRAADALIAFLAAGGSQRLSRAHYNAKVASLFALGYLVNRTKSPRALTYLRESVDPAVWRSRGIAWTSPLNPSADERDLHLTKMAIAGLGLTGDAAAAQTLQALSAPAQSDAMKRIQPRLKDSAADALRTNATISRVGLAGFFQPARP